MGPKAKPGAKKKGKKEEEDPEFVTELMKQFFELTMQDIQRKTERQRTYREEMYASLNDIEVKMAEFEQAQSVEIKKLNELMYEKEAERIEKRDRMFDLTEELPRKYRELTEHLMGLEKRYNDTYEELTSRMAELDEQDRQLRHYKGFRVEYDKVLAEKQEEIVVREQEQHRAVYKIEEKFEMKTARLKVELEGKLQELSCNFVEKSELKIEPTTTRLIRENVAIELELKAMRHTLRSCQKDINIAENSLKLTTAERRKVVGEKELYIGRSLVQREGVAHLIKVQRELLEEIKSRLWIEDENKRLLARLKEAEEKLAKLSGEVSQLNKYLVASEEEVSQMGRNSGTFKRNTRLLTALLDSLGPLTKEGIAVHAVPMGELPGERTLGIDERLKRFYARRDAAFTRRGTVLTSLLDVLSRIRELDEDRKLLATSEESLQVAHINYSGMFSQALFGLEDELSDGMQSTASSTSLPRAISIPALTYARPRHSSSSEEDEAKDEEVVAAPLDTGEPATIEEPEGEESLFDEEEVWGEP